MAAALDLRVEMIGRWRAGDLDRLLNAKHSVLHEQVARTFRDEWPGWVIEPEVSFSIYGERGVIDVLAWHPRCRALLVVELKTDIVDINDLVGSVDRKRRLGPRIAIERGWHPVATSVWVIVSAGRTNRARIEAHAAILRAAFPVDGRRMRAWVETPDHAVAALSTWQNDHRGNVVSSLSSVRRVQARRTRPR